MNWLVAGVIVTTVSWLVLVGIFWLGEAIIEKLQKHKAGGNKNEEE